MRTRTISRGELRGSGWSFALMLLLAATFVLLAACGDDDSEDDPRRAQVGATAELATYAYAASGAEGLYDYLAPAVTEKCTQEQVAEALAAEEAPTDFRGLNGVEFDGDRATATIGLIFRDEDRKVEWTFVQTEGESWRLIAVPGLGECAG